MGTALGWTVWGALSACGADSGARTEATPAACSDGIDDDGDGYVDCADQDCAVFAVCLGADGGPDSDGDTDADTDADTDTSTGSDTDTGPPLEEPGCHGEDWIVEPIEAGCSAPSIAVDASGAAHVSYYRNQDPIREIHYATNAGGAWVSERVVNVATLGFWGWNSSLAIASDGSIRIAYSLSGYNGAGALGYATNESGLWETENADTTWSYYPSLVLDEADHAHIAYVNVIPGGYDPVRRLRYATNAGGAWEIADLGIDGSGETSLLVDDEGHDHLAACGAWDRLQVRYATNAGGDWEVEDVDDGDFTQCALALDSAGLLHLYYDDDLSNIHSATLGGGAWDLDLVGIAETWLGHMRIDAGDAFHVVYTGPVGAEGIRYSVGDEADWDESVVVELPSNPFEVDMAIGPDREPHVVYADPTDATVYSAYCR